MILKMLLQVLTSLGWSSSPPPAPCQQHTYWKVLFLLQGRLLLPQPVPELINTLVHDRHF